MSKQNALLLMVLVTLIWSTNGFLIKLVTWSPMPISGVRSLLAALALLPFLVVGEMPGRWALAGGMVVLSSVTLHAILRRQKK